MSLLKSPLVKTAIVSVIAVEVWYRWIRPMVFKTTAA